MGWVVNAISQPLYVLEGDPVPIVQEAGQALGLVWMCRKNLSPTAVYNSDS